MMLQKLILTSLLLNFVFGIGGVVCLGTKYHKLEKLCWFLLGLNGVFILVAVLIKVWGV
jgi:hypothetical protein